MKIGDGWFPTSAEWRRRLVIAQAAVSLLWATLAISNAAFHIWFWCAVDVFGCLVSTGFLYRNLLMEKDLGPHRKPRPQMDNDSSDRTRPANHGASMSATDSSRPETDNASDTETRTRSGLGVGEVYGFRAWEVAGPYLFSFMGELWLPGAPMVARDSLELDNTSGVHAFKSLVDAQRYCHGPAPRAVGRVKLWGTIVEHETGYRGQYAKPVELLEVHDGALPYGISRLYEIPYTP